MTRPQQALERIATDEHFHGIAAISGHDAVTNITGVSNKTPFPIHSVGKILSGVLMVEMVTQGIITESDLTTPGIKLQPEIEEKLTRENPAVIERLSQVSILQAMHHTAGLASLNEESGSKDCIDNYTKHLREGKEVRRSMGDMVDFVGDKLTEIGPEKYSNDGLLLAGFALQNLYNLRTGQNLSYEEILNKLVIDPSRTNISMTRPVDVHYKAEDVEHLSKYPVTPAGGHFASSDDLLKLGEYLYQRCQDPKFMEGIKKYGAEFYDESRNTIYHGGYMEGTTYEAKGSATEFAVSLNDGKTIAILMDRDASEDDRDSGRLKQTHARVFYKELRSSLEQESERENSIFSKLDNPQENLVLDAESKLKISEAIAAAHIDRIESIDEEKRQSFMPKLAAKLRVELPELIAVIEDKEKLAALFFKLKDEELISFNKDKDGLPAIKPTNLTAPAIQEYCDTIDFRGVMVIEDGKGNQTKISNYHKGTQSDPQDRPFATHSVSKLIAGVTICKMIADGIIPQEALDRKLELAPEVKEKLPEEILKHLEEHSVTLRDVMTHHSGLGGYLDPELKKGQPGYGTRELGYGVNGYSGYVRDQLEKGEAVEVPTSPQDYLKYSERETYEYGKFKYSDLGIVLASLSAEHYYNNKIQDPSEHKSFEEIVKETLIIPAGVEKFSAQKPADAIFHSDDPIAPYITGTAGCGYWTNLDGLVKIGKQIGKMWQEDTAFRDVIQNCGQEFYDEKLNIIRHPGGIDSSKTLLSVDLNNGSVVATEERRLGSDFPFPGWGVVIANRNINKEQELQESEMKVLSEDNIQTTDQKWSERFPSRKSAEAEDLIPQKKSWKDVLEATNKSKDDSTITR